VSPRHPPLCENATPNEPPTSPGWHVSDDYESPFRFTGKLARVVLDVSDANFDAPTAEARVKLGLAVQ
jgi:hypothetical protein